MFSFHKSRLGIKDFSVMPITPLFLGFNRRCYGDRIVFDECHRRCLCKNGKFTKCHRVRKEFTEMSLKERRRYVRTFRKASKDVPYKWTYDIITKMHPQFFDTIHERELFFPWHRWYLLLFENLLRCIDCRVTVPYWNWAHAVSRKRVWRQGLQDIWSSGFHGFGGNGDGRTGCVKTGPFKAKLWSLPSWLDSACLSRNFDYKYKLPGEMFVNDLRKLHWKSFCAFDEGVREMHDDLHNAIGGVMEEKESSAAPEFWLHHAFLDKIWSDWQDRGPEYKFAYFWKVKKKLPGATHLSWELLDLQNQPHCVRILYVSHNRPGKTENGKRSHYYMNHESHKLKMKGSFDNDLDADACDVLSKGKHDKAI